jgi:ATP-binding cassette subfamily B protein
MAWGGSGIGLGAGMGSAPSGPGLPFGGIPHEMAERVERLLDEEPEWPAARPAFSHRSARAGVNLRSLLRPYRKLFLATLVLVVVEALSIQAGPLLSAIVIDHGIVAGDMGVVIAVAGAALLAVVISIVAGGLRVALTGRIAATVMFDLRGEVFAHLQRLSLDYYTREKAGVIMTRMMSDIEALHTLFQDGLVQFGVQGLTMAIVTVALVALDPELALITLLAILPILTALSLWFRKASDQGYGRVRDGLAAVLTDVSEGLAGVRVVAAFNRQRHNVLNHRNVVGEYRDRNDEMGRTLAAFGGSTEFVGLMGQAMLLLIGGLMIRAGELSIGELTAFILYLNAMFQPIQQLVQQYSLYQQGQAAILKVNDLLRTAPTVEEAPDARPLPPLEGAIQFDKVAFAYDPATPVLRDVDLRIRAGETLALVGPTGGGKSTIAKLITRFYDPTAGSIRIDGHHLRTATLDSLRRQLGVVPQEPYLFAGTVRDNIAFAKPDATDAEVRAAVHAVGLDELIARLPAGVQTPVHERGVSLSSGERQLIALARAFLAGPRVLVLDEATSNLDLRSERLVEAALETLLQGRTAIIVAHRLTTAMRADRIAVVERGRIVELGSHEALLAAGGRYSTMHDAWMQYAGQGSAT